MVNEAASKGDGCRLFSMVQYQCSPEGGQVTCWPLERIFRQYVIFGPSVPVLPGQYKPNSGAVALTPRCGKGPAIEVTNAVIRDKKGNVTGVEQAFV